MAQSNQKAVRWLGLRNSNGTNFFQAAPEQNIVPETTYELFRNFSPNILLSIAENLGVNNIIRMFNYLRPSFDAVAKIALKNVMEKNKEAELRIHIGWNEETFYRVLELLDIYVERILIIGPTDGKLINSDIDRIQNIFAKCPNVKHLRFKEFLSTSEYLKNINFVPKLHALKTICLLDCNRFINILELPKEITEFNARVSATDKVGCQWCSSFDISQISFVTFLLSSYTLRSVTLHVVRRHCGNENKCKLTVQKFLLHLNSLIAGRRMTKFDVRIGDTTHKLVKMKSNAIVKFEHDFDY